MKRPKWLTIGMIQISIGVMGGAAILAVIGFPLYNQWRDMGELAKQIQALPTATPKPKSTIAPNTTPLPGAGLVHCP